MNKIEENKSFSKEHLGQLIIDISGLPIKEYIEFPEIELLSADKKNPHTGPFTFHLVIGETGSQYDLKMSMSFDNGYKHEDWNLNSSWQLDYNNETLYQEESGKNIHQFTYNDIFNPMKIRRVVYEEALHIIGGPDTETAFMDFESYSLESLHHENSYFANVYLVLLTHMKERGLTMPPILSKIPDIKNSMDIGDINEINKLLSTYILFGSSIYDERCRAHIRAEIDEIKKVTLIQNQKRNKNIPIEKAFPYADVIPIKIGVQHFNPYTILVVENEIRSYGLFTQIVKRALEKDGRYLNTVLISEINLSCCMDFCQCDRIDLVLFDWTNPSYWEVLMMQSGYDNPFYRMMFGDTQAVVNFSEEGPLFNVPDGRLFDEEAMKEEEKRINIRSKWMQMIEMSCSKQGVIPPPYFIFQSMNEQHDITKIISQKLRNSL